MTPKRRFGAELERHVDTEVSGRTDALLSTSTTGEPVRYRSLRRSFDAACRQVGLVDVTALSLRASCDSRVAANDGVLEAVRRLGHRRSSVTIRQYAWPMAGGDTIVAARLDNPRRQTAGAGATANPPKLARIWHKTRIARMEDGCHGRTHLL